MDRPSRFDRKYHFDLPELPERSAYLRLWQNKLASKVDWTDQTTEAIAEATSADALDRRGKALNRRHDARARGARRADEDRARRGADAAGHDE
jgi:hypothetical protein